MIRIQKLYAYTSERRFIWFLCVVFLVALFLYILLLTLTTFNIAAHNTLSNEIQILNSQIGNLEARYIVLNRNISHEYAYALGFKKPQKEIFAFRKRLVQNNINAF